VVGESSATLDADNKEGLALDHFDMNKFENEKDGIFRQVCWQLEKMARRSAEIRGQRGRGETHSFQVSDWLGVRGWRSK